MTTDGAISQLTKERDSMLRQIEKREKEIAHFDERLSHSLMPNQVAMLKAQRSRQISMLAANRSELASLEKSLTSEIANPRSG